MTLTPNMPTEKLTQLPRRKLIISLLLLIMSMNTAFAIPEVVPNKPLNQAEAQVINTQSAIPALTKLKASNTELATKNATLEQENNALQTQLNVLTEERSSQLFMTGAFIAIGGIFLGFIGAWLLLGRKNNDW